MHGSVLCSLQLMIFSADGSALIPLLLLMFLEICVLFLSFIYTVLKIITEYQRKKIQKLDQQLKQFEIDDFESYLNYKEMETEF